MRRAFLASLMALALLLAGAASDARADWSKPTVYIGANLFDLTLPIFGEFGDIGPALRPLVGASWQNEDARVYVGGDVELTFLGSEADRLTIGAGVGWKSFAFGGAYSLTDHVGLDGSLHVTGALGAAVAGVD